VRTLGGQLLKNFAHRLLTMLCAIAVALLAVSVRTPASTQDVLDLVNDNLVMIECTCEGRTHSEGQGFIVGQIGTEVYIATAKHVVTSNTPGCPENISIRFRVPNVTSNVVDKRLNGPHDLAILVVSAPDDLQWEKKVLDVTAPWIDEFVWLFSRADPWEIPSSGTHGYISKIDDQGKNTRIHFRDLHVVQGDSGGILITQDGIVGMLQVAALADGRALHVDSVPEAMQAWEEVWRSAWQLEPLERDNAVWIGPSLAWNVPHSESYLGLVAGFSCPAEGLVEGIGSWDLSLGGSAFRTNRYLTLKSVTVSVFWDLNGPLADQLAEHRVALYGGGGLGFTSWKATSPELASPFSSISGNLELGIRCYCPSGVGIRAFARYTGVISELAGYPHFGIAAQYSF